MKNLTQTQLDRVDSFKTEKGCEKVFIDDTYSEIRLFPVYNEASEKFLTEIFEKGSYSRFDRLILETLDSKSESVEELISIYDNAIDSLD
ncbi:MAG: hypothetical protein NXI00_16155 [Cytophagales bacterium]|nr:hypothetical protein [Cytophagales bacterium]